MDKSNRSIDGKRLRKILFSGYRWLLVLPVTFFLLVLFTPLPRPLFNHGYATVITSAEGNLLNASVAPDEQWRFAPGDSIPRKFQVAIRLFEDEHFYRHPGVNPVSVARAAKQNLEAGRVVSGGSTLTMQLARMIRGNQSRNLWHKFTEMLTAFKIEMVYSKDEILRIYTANAPFGGNVVGLEAAAWRYYGRPSHRLSWSETAALAVLPNDPSAVYPGKNKVKHLNKRNFLLRKLYRHGFLDSLSMVLARAEELPAGPTELPSLSAHLLNHVREDGREQQTTRTSLRYQLQVKVKNRLDRYSRRLQKSEIYNAAALVTDVRTRQVIAYVGNADVAKGNHGQHVNIIRSLRSPGSLLKPLLYAAALDQGELLPGELLPDIPQIYDGFAPENFDKTFRGAVPADQALTMSLNVPFVFLLRDYGYERFHRKLQTLGMNSLNKPPSHYGLSLILGSPEASLWDLTAMYAGLTEVALKTETDPYLSDDFRPLRILYADTARISSVPVKYGPLRKGPAQFTMRALRNLNRPEGYSYGFSRDISWKTGTSFGFKDAWAIGSNGRYVVSVWIGNADGEGRPELIGSRTAAPLLFGIFEDLREKEEFPELYAPARYICTKSGLVATGKCVETREVQLPEYMVTGRQCAYHQTVFLDSSSTWQVNSSCYPVSQMKSESWFILPPVQAWYYKPYHPFYRKLPDLMPACKTEVSAPTAMQLIYPANHTRLFIPREVDGEKGRTVFEAAHSKPDTDIYWHLDEVYIGKTNGQHTLTLNPGAGRHLLTLVDQDGKVLQRSFEVISK